MTARAADDPALTTADYPLAEKRPDLVRTASGKGLTELSLAAVAAGEVTMADLRITAAALRQQAAIARAAGRATLAQNFERAAELVDVPQETLLRIYELLRPGRAKDKEELLAAAALLRRDFGAVLMADFIVEAAEVYERRGLFTRRF
ncbi:MAG TPA: diol dehydratase small subunit [Terriglobia bacterium]|nr:diol dehydratase small subunit [Terriglobia bacterium]